MYSPEGITTELKCPDGSYTSDTENGSCTRCSAGKYCFEDSSNATGPKAEIDCPEGYYCPADTSWYGRYPCDIGKYGAATLL